MRPSRSVRWMAVMMMSVAALGAVTALAAANSVPASRIGQSNHPVTLQQLAPPECAAIAGGLTSLFVGSGTIDGNNGNNLILGSAGDDLIRARQGNDCVVGGGGNDDLRGNQGDDVLLGGSGNDALAGGQGQDTCYGGSGNDTETGCETTFDIP
jgi:Ca2+-binding RTX toxin-like protein